MTKKTKNLLLLMLSWMMVSTLQAQVHPGIKIEEFRQKIPGVVPAKVYFDEDITVPQKIMHFNGNWHLDFNHDTLRSIYYNHELGMKPQAGAMASYDTIVKKFTEKMGDPAWKNYAADTFLNPDRKRRENIDTIRVVRWKTRFAEVTLGLYLTGNRKIKMTPQERASQNMINAEASRNFYQFNIHVKKVNYPGYVHAWDLYPGLHVYKVMELKPSWLPNGVSINGQWSREEEIQGLKVKRSFRFKNSELQWTMWSHYAGEQNKVAFEKCLKATEALIEQYTQKYGFPVIVQGDTKYRDPYKKQHWGYDVIKATWDLPTYTIEIEYVFTGGKGQYDLVVKIQEQKK